MCFLHHYPHTHSSLLFRSHVFNKPCITSFIHHVSSLLLSLCVLQAALRARKTIWTFCCILMVNFLVHLRPNDVSCMSTHLAMLRTGSVSAPRFTQAGCASSVPVSETPAVMEPRASRSRRWRPCVSAPMEDKVYCVMNVSVTAPHRSMQLRFCCFIKKLICKQLVNESPEQLVE